MTSGLGLETLTLQGAYFTLRQATPPKKQTMKLFRNNQIVLSDKVNFYANILRKAQIAGVEGPPLTNDEFIEAELTDRWEKQYPTLIEAWERNNQVRQENKKVYEKIEAETLAAITPNPRR